MRQIAMIAPLAVLYVADEAGVQSAVKWPNDVQVTDKKLAGVLIETALSEEAGAATVLCGIGLNVNFDPRAHDETRDIATSLFVELGHPVEREPLLASLLLHFEGMYAKAKAGASMLDEWRARLVTLGEQVQATLPDRVVEGRAEDVDETGALLVRTADNKLVTVEAGDVTLRR
jgi:BirA family biotin operon repressor/biotin-[acetyl-CoA-carboxylase] ligase